MKIIRLSLLFLLFSFNVYSQDQTVELCDHYNNIFTYKSPGTPNCTYNWIIYLNDKPYKTYQTEEITIKYEKTGIYKIEVYSENELCRSSTQNYVINVIPCRMPALYIPTAFTPNNDNLNDVFGVRGQYIDQIEIYVYNRWGNIVFYTQDMTQTWDGNNAPEGAYVFYVIYKDINGFYNVEYGTLTLYR